MKIIFYYHTNKTHFHKKGFSFGLVLRVRVFVTWNSQETKAISCNILSPEIDMKFVRYC